MQTSESNMISITEQFSKLRVYPAPGVHHLAAGCTHFGTCAPGVHIWLPGAHILVTVHPMSAPYFRVFCIHLYRSDQEENSLGAQFQDNFESLRTRCVHKIKTSHTINAIAIYFNWL